LIQHLNGVLNIEPLTLLAGLARNLQQTTGVARDHKVCSGAQDIP
jgi:hypothetical protein